MLHRLAAGWRASDVADEVGRALPLVGVVLIAAFGAPLLFAAGFGILVLVGEGFLRRQRAAARPVLIDAITRRVRELDPEPIGEDERPSAEHAGVASWNAFWRAHQPVVAEGQTLAEQARGLPPIFEARIRSITSASDRQEEAVEETASLVANMRQSMNTVSDRVDQLLAASEESAASMLELDGSIDEVANNSGTLHEVVDQSTSTVHQMGASIRQVAAGAEQVLEMAESTAAAVTEMDRSIQEVSTNAVEAATLTERAREGAGVGQNAVGATIADIERISELSTGAMDRLDGLVRRISEIGTILQAIDEINDETNLLSLNAAIIAAQAGEQGKAFLVVANHVKTLARRTAASTQDIERLISTIQEESASAVKAMRAGIEAVDTGVERSRDAGTALESIRESCHEASERVAEIARATAEQSRNSKGVAESTQRTSTQIQQITDAIAEQRRASENMLTSAESALASCLQVHRSTDEQRQTSQHITGAIATISEMIREIGIQTRTHRDASEAVSESVMVLLENAKAAGADVAPLRELVDALARQAEAASWPTGIAATEPRPPTVDETTPDDAPAVAS